MKPIISFDLDETLIHAKKSHWLALNDAFKIYNLPYVDYSKLSKFLDGRTAHEVVRTLFPKLNKKIIDNIAKMHRSLVAKKYAKDAKLIPGVIKTLKTLRKNYTLVLATNCTHLEVNSFFKAIKIDKNLFDLIIGKEDVKRSKPFPDEILKIQQKLKQKVSFHVGDSIYDIIAARRAKVKPISVLTGVTKKDKLQKEKPYKIIKSIVYLPGILKEV
ncbi:MAG: HAD family hydrolase [Candidatus Nanoarchaeia archaeon]|nr:HAD family hydrolase [Candidatus Nanoarchaeia archaeon]MDD5587648.1 HAD family hydrolase [Candidatus Nanoarchaeia archaeon]